MPGNSSPSRAPPTKAAATSAHSPGNTGNQRCDEGACFQLSTLTALHKTLPIPSFLISCQLCPRTNNNLPAFLITPYSKPTSPASATYTSLQDHCIKRLPPPPALFYISLYIFSLHLPLTTLVCTLSSLQPKKRKSLVSFSLFSFSPFLLKKNGGRDWW